MVMVTVVTYVGYAGSDQLRENTCHIKSVLLAGPEGSGKTMLVNAICSELGDTCTVIYVMVIMPMMIMLFSS